MHPTTIIRLQLRKVERDKKTMDQEIVELTNKLLDAKNTIDKLEELNVGVVTLSLSELSHTRYEVRCIEPQCGGGGGRLRP